MINEWWLLLFLPISAASGWWTATRKRGMGRFSKNKDIFPSHYLQGLNFLLNEEQDKAVDVFIKLLEIDSDTVETHLALGNLFRRRGEVNRAIRIHQNLIARPNLDKRYRTEALAALAKDYLSAGVLDRAERLFLELVDLGEQENFSLRNLLDIYQQEKEWQKAIDLTQKLFKYADEAIRVAAAHYHCELAEEALKNGQLEVARRLSKQALSIDRQCVRANLLFAEAEMMEGRYRKAIRYLKHVKVQDPDYLSETVVPLMKAYRGLNKEELALRYFRGLLREFPKIPIVAVLSDQIRQYQGEAAAVSFVKEYVRTHPSVAGLHRLVELHLSFVDEPAKDDLLVLHELTEKLLKEQYRYQCLHCGFRSKTLHWQCPGCRKWSSMKPIYTLEDI